MPGEHVDIRVLSLVNEERNAYGLRSNEYGRYHAHCSHKVQRLRQNLKLTHGRGREFKTTPPVAKENLTNAHFCLSLFEAERAWSYSHELATHPRYADDRALRHRAAGRFRRAVYHSAALLTQARSLFFSDPKRISAGPLLEISAYHLTFQGRFYLRRDDFQLALDHLAVARGVLVELANDTAASRDQALCTLFSDEIAPQIRFAAHSLGHQAAYNIHGIVKGVNTSTMRDALVPGHDEIVRQLREERTEEAARSGGSGQAMLRVPLWEGKPVPIRNPELVDAFIRVQSAEDTMAEGRRACGRSGTTGPKVALPAASKTMRGGVAAFDGVLLALADAQQVAQKLSESEELSGAADLGDGATAGRDTHFVYAYTTYRLLSRRIERDLLLVDFLLSPLPATIPKLSSKPATSGAVTSKDNKSAADPRINPGLVKLYDTILQSLEQMRNLSIVDETLDLVPSVESRLAFSRARRLLYLSRTYGTLQQYAEALSLTAKAHIYLREARSILSTSSTVQDEVKAGGAYQSLTLDGVSRFEEDLINEESTLKLDWYAFNGGAATSLPQDDKPKKPMFYDVAFNYVELPMERLQARAGGQAGLTARAPPGVTAEASRAVAQQTSPGPTAENGKRERRLTKVEGAPPTPDVRIVQSGGFGIGGILGGWWGRQ